MRERRYKRRLTAPDLVPVDAVEKHMRLFIRLPPLSLSGPCGAQDSDMAVQDSDMAVHAVT